MDRRPVSEIDRSSKWRIYPAGWILFATVGIGSLIYFTKAIIESREAASQTSCRGHLSHFLLALHNYHDVYGSFPPAYVADENGQPMHSWRVLLLPYLDSKEVYEQYRFDEPWNGPRNSQLARRIRTSLFHCRSGPHGDDSVMTDYVVISGPGTAFPGSRSTKLEDFVDGTSNTILLAEVARSDIHWMEPRDLNVDEMSFRVNDPSRPSISSPHPGGPAVVFADRITAFRIRQPLSAETLKAFTTIAGHEDVSRDNQIRPAPDMPYYLGE